MSFLQNTMVTHRVEKAITVCIYVYLVQVLGAFEVVVDMANSNLQQCTVYEVLIE